MFKKGEIVKSKNRTEGHELFLLVLYDPSPSPIQFNAVVIKDLVNEEENGLIANNWNTEQFVISDIKDLSKAVYKNGN